MSGHRASQTVQGLSDLLGFILTSGDIVHGWTILPGPDDLSRGVLGANKFGQAGQEIGAAGRTEDFHLQADVQARHTKIGPLSLPRAFGAGWL